MDLNYNDSVACFVSSHQIVTDCDNKVRQMKQIEELVCLKALLDFDKVKVIFLFIFFKQT